MSCRRVIQSLASMRLTIVLLVAVAMLVVVGTVAQVGAGIAWVKAAYFETWLVWWRAVPVFPGGYLLGTLLVVNLLAATGDRRWWRPGRRGLLLTHAGLVLLLGGMMLSSMLAEESVLQLATGEAKHYSEQPGRSEIAISHAVDAATLEVTAIPESVYRRRRAIDLPHLPFSLRILTVYPASRLVRREQVSDAVPAPATHGDGRDILVGVPPHPAAELAPSAIVEVVVEGMARGTWLLSAAAVWDGAMEQPYPDQTVEVAGTSYALALRPRRLYGPVALRLDEFRHERHPRSDIPSRFASQVTIFERGREPRPATISMNQPLRLHGRTYYQASYADGGRTSVLQVVDNPGWFLPYVACAVVGLGLLWHFGQRLYGYLRTRPAAGPREPLPGRQGVCLGAAAAVWLAVVLLPGRPPAPAAGAWHFGAFGRLPVLEDGRVKPLDSVARNALLSIHGKQHLRTAAGRLGASAWLAWLTSGDPAVDQVPLFRIDSPDVLGLLRVEAHGRYYSFAAIEGGLPHLEEQIRQPAATPEERVLYRQVVRYMRLRNSLLPTPGTGAETVAFFPIPPGTEHAEWRSMAEAPAAPMAADYRALAAARRSGNAEAFNRAADQLLASWRAHRLYPRARAEYVYNHAQLFYRALLTDVLVFVLVALAWLTGSRWCRRLGEVLLTVGFLLMTLAIAWRTWLHGYLPVTNLYGSAVVVGWGGVLVGIVLERRRRDGLAAACAAVLGFGSLVIAQHLARGGDTMGMLRAVLDSNLWLTAHVLTIVLGYSGTFLAGLLGIAWILRRRPDPTLGASIYAVLCFATLFSFVGTVLGGIWADQAWGRFWGWDPKENGALLVVTWNALILHARAAGYVRDRGLAMLAVAGNIVTALCWFGVNMLGVGLHSYGWMQGGARWLALFAASQLLAIAFGLVPGRGPAAD